MLSVGKRAFDKFPAGFGERSPLNWVFLRFLKQIFDLRPPSYSFRSTMADKGDPAIDSKLIFNNYFRFTRYDSSI